MSESSINNNEKRKILAKLISEKNIDLRFAIEKTYRNYIFAIINKNLESKGLLNNIYVDQNEIYDETIDSIFNLKEDKILSWNFKTLVGHTAVFTAHKYVRKMNTSKCKISFLCGYQTQENYDDAIYRNGFDEFDEVQNQTIKNDEIIRQLFQHIYEKDDFGEINEKQKIIFKIILFKVNGLKNNQIGKILNLKRRQVYDIYNRWLKKYKNKIFKFFGII